MASGLTRYAQPQPALVVRVWEQMRRVLWSLNAGSELLESDGEQLLARATSDGDAAGSTPGDRTDLLVVVLRAAAQLDALGDVVVAWAVKGGDERPDAEVESVVRDVEQLLDAAGVPHEPREGPPPGRARRGV